MYTMQEKDVKWGKGEQEGPNKSVLLATSHGVICERRSVSSLKTENKL